YLSDPQFAPLATDPQKELIEKRRRILWHYYIERNHFERIIAMVILNVLALMVAISEPLFGVRVWPWISHLLIVFAVFANESLILRWRLERDASLAAIDA